MATATTRRRERPTEETIVDDDELQAVLDALQDGDCRAVLDETSDHPRSASELSESCDLPLSTTYRKLDILTERGLLVERTRISSDGKHASEYVRAVDDVRLAADADADGGFELTVTKREVVERAASVGMASGD